MKICNILDLYLPRSACLGLAALLTCELASCGGSAGPASPPAPPSSFTASAGDRNVQLSWARSASASSYRVYFATASGVTTSASAVATTSDPSYLHEGLTNGVRYYYIVTARNDAGESAPSLEVSAEPRAPVPLAPAGFTAIAGDEAVTLSWEDRVGQPEAEGVPTVRSYNIYWGATADSLVGKIQGVRSPYTHAGVENGATYVYAIAGVNAAGEGPRSASVTAAPTRVLPLGPVGLEASGGDGLVLLSWEDRIGVAGTAASPAVTSYTLYFGAQPNPYPNGSYITDVRSPFVHDGRANGVASYYVLVAENDAGLSPPSASVAATPRSGLPLAPSALAASAGDAQVTITWDDRVGLAGSIGNPAVTSYKLYVGIEPNPLISGQRVDAVRSPFVHTGRVNGTTYYYALRAVSAAGEGPHAGPVSAMPAARLPLAPSGVAATAGDQQIELRWNDRVGAAGTPTDPIVTSYSVTFSTTAGGAALGTRIANVRSPYTHTGRSNGTTYYYVVAATNSWGQGPASVEVSARPSGQEHQVRGTVTGLIGSGLGLSNGHETLTINASGPFAFPTSLASGTSYNVTVVTPPTSPQQACIVHAGQGTMGATDITGVEVACSLQIATFNLHELSTNSSDAKKQGIAAIINDNGFDVVAVQEVADGAVLEQIIAYLDPSWSYELGASGTYDQHVGVLFRTAVVTRLDAYELDAAHTAGVIDGSRYPWYALRLPLLVRLEANGNGLTFDLIAVHLKAMSSGCETRLAQVTALATYLAGRPAGDFVVAGDFNDEIADYGVCSASAIDALAPLENDSNLSFATAQPSSMDSSLHTFPSWDSTIDHIIVNDGLWPHLFAVDASGHRASVVVSVSAATSDHQPPYIWLAFE